MTKLVILLLLVSPFVWAQDEPLAPEWTFDGADAEDELELWVTLNQLQPLEIDEVVDQFGEKRSVLLTESTGGDPYMYPGGSGNNVDYEPFEGEDFFTLYMGVRVNTPGNWQIYYITQEDAAWAEVQRQNFMVDSVDEFQDMEIVLERGGWQDHLVTNFRIDPGTAAGVESEIDYISFLGIPGGVQSVNPQSKLSTTWATLRAYVRDEYTAH